MNFETAYLSRENRYSLGTETESGSRHMAIPVSNQKVDYMEYYKLSDGEYEAFIEDAAVAVQFADSCRRREQDDRLFMQPGTDRGAPR